MPISLRLPAEIESQLAGFSARAGLSKSALIVRSIREFLVKHTQPSSLQIFEEVMHDLQGGQGDAKREAAERRPHKLKIRAAIRRKHARRAEGAAKVLAKRRPGASRRA